MDYYRIFTDAAVIIASDGTVVKDSGEWKRLSNSYRYDLPALRSKITELDLELAAEKEKVRMAEANRDHMARDLEAAQADLNRELYAKSSEGVAAHVTELQTKLAKANAELADCKRRLDAYGADVDLRVYVAEGKTENYKELLETERAARNQAEEGLVAMRAAYEAEKERREDAEGAEADLATARADVADLRSIAESGSAERDAMRRRLERAERPAPPVKCSWCRDTGVEDSGNNELPCQHCLAGAAALFNHLGALRTGAQVLDDLGLKPAPSPTPPDPTLPLAARVVELTEKLSTETAKRQGAEAACDYMGRELQTALADFKREMRDLRDVLDVQQRRIDALNGLRAADRIDSAKGLEFVKSVLDILGLDHKGPGLYEANLTALRKLKTQLRNEVSANEDLKSHLDESQKVVKSQSKALRDYERAYAPLPSATKALADEQDMDFKHGKPAGLTRQELIDACITAAFKAGQDAVQRQGPSPALMFLAEELRK